MKYRLLGKTGLRVSELSLGTMTFGEEWGYGADRDESKRIFDAFADAGGNFIDTANRYTEGTSERYLGEFMASQRDRFILATKYSLFDCPGDHINRSGNSRQNMMRSVEGSLKRLNTEYIDLFYLHAWDFLTPVEEILRGIDDLVRAGKVHYAGISDTPAWIVSRANTIADLRGWTRFSALQVEYSLIQRTVERDLLPMAREMDIAVTAWAALAGGALTGKYLSQNDDPKRLTEGSARLNERSRAITQAVVDVARELGCSPAHVAINWVRQKNQTVIPVIGARRLSQIQESLTCLDHPLPQEAITRLDAVSAIDLGFPHDFLAGPTVTNILFSGQKDKIVNG